MRRPPPLPPSERSATVPADAVDARAIRVPRRDAAPREPGGDRPAEPDASIAPVVPIGAASAMARPLELPGAEGEDGQGADRAPADVGIREVWSAARSRRKALRAEVRRFTARQRHRRLAWAGGAASLVVLVLVTLGAAYSPLFAVEQIRVVGADGLDAGAVEQALSDQLGTPLPLVDESAVKAALVAFPLVESYSLEAHPPHELVVRIVERTPIGLVQTRAGYTLVDAAGVALSTTETPAPGRPLLTVTGGTASPAFTAVGQVMRSLPDAIAAQVTAVAASTPDDVTLTLGGSNAQVVWGSAEDSAMKAIALEKIMAGRPPATVSMYDVSSPSAIVVR